MAGGGGIVILLQLTPVAQAIVASVTSTALGAILAPGLLVDLAGVGGVRGGVEVGLPDVHLGAASAVVAGARVAVRAAPALRVGLFTVLANPYQESWLP